MAAIEAEIARGDDAAAGPGHYALGRGYLVLDDDVHAREHLAVAWNAGYREPRVAYALAQVMGHLYQRHLLAAEGIDDRTEGKEMWEARKREIGWRYRDPALGFLAQSQGIKELASPRYVAALVAYYEGRFADALQHIDAIEARAWFYEVPELRGDILLARALGLRDGGEHDRARDDFEAGRKAYAVATDVGRGVPAIYQSLAALEHAAMTMELYGHGDMMPPASRALEATAHALAIEPDHYEARVLAAGIRRSMAEHRANQGETSRACSARRSRTPRALSSCRRCGPRRGSRSHGSSASGPPIARISTRTRASSAARRSRPWMPCRWTIATPRTGAAGAWCSRCGPTTRMRTAATVRPTATR
jgi:serine/threonine-protein kinase